MALVIDIMHGRGPINKMCHQLQPKNANGLALNIRITVAAKAVLGALHY